MPWFYSLLLLACAGLIVIQYLALTWLAPRYVVHVVERAAGGTLVVDEARLSFPLTTKLKGLRLVNGTPASTLSIQRVVIKPSWLSIPTKTLWLNALHIEQPLLRLTRTKSGEMVWPSLPATMTGGRATTTAGAPSPGKPKALPSWRIHIHSLQIEEGVIELVDEMPAVPFHGILHHVSVSIGSVSFPLEDAQTSFAIRAELIGRGGDAAPVFCSGWVGLTDRNLQASCQLEPLRLAALEPYFQGIGRVQVRVYETTLKSTSQWLAKSNQLVGRVQFELANLMEGDLSVRGRTIVDVKELTGGEASRLSAELQITGPLDAPSAWHSAFVPGDVRVQQLLQPLLDRGIEMIKVPLLGRKIDVNIAPANAATITGVEEASKQVQEDLKIIAAPLPQAPPASGTEGAAQGSSQPGAPVATPSGQVETAAPTSGTPGPGTSSPAASTPPASKEPSTQPLAPSEQEKRPPRPAAPSDLVPAGAAPSGS